MMKELLAIMILVLATNCLISNGMNDNKPVDLDFNIIYLDGATSQEHVLKYPNGDLIGSVAHVSDDDAYRINVRLIDGSGEFTSSDGRVLIAIAYKERPFKNIDRIFEAAEGGRSLQDLSFAKWYNISKSDFKSEVSKLPNTNFEITTISFDIPPILFSSIPNPYGFSKDERPFYSNKYLRIARMLVLFEAPNGERFSKTLEYNIYNIT